MASTLEEDFPGLIAGIRQLRNEGFTDDEIDRAIQARITYRQRATGAPGEAVDAWLKGKPSPLTGPRLSTGREDIVGGRLRTTTKYGELDPLALAEARQNYKLYDEATRLPPGVDPMTGRTPWGIDFSSWRSNLKRNLDTVGDWFSGFAKGAADNLRIQGHTISDSAAAGSAAFYRDLAELTRPPQAPEVMEDPLGFTARRVGALGTVLSGGVPQMLGEYVSQPIERAGLPGTAALARTATEATTGMLMTPGIGFKVPEGGVLAKAFQVGESMQIPSATRASGEAAAALAEVEKFTDPVAAGGGLSMEEQIAQARRGATEQAQRVSPQTLEEPEGGVAVATEEPTAPVTPGGEVSAPRGRGRPVVRPVDVRTGTTQLSDDAVRNVIAAHLVKNAGATYEEALASAKTMEIGEARDIAGNLLRSLRLETGELTGKRGRPRVVGMPEPEAPSSGSDLVDEMTTKAPSGQTGVATTETTSRDVRLPAGEVTKQPVYSLGQLRKLADSKGFDLQYDSTNQVEPFKFIANGGEEKTFKSLSEVGGYLDSQEAVPRQPVELKTAQSGDSAFERAVKGEALNDEHKLNVQRQKMQMETARAKPGGLLGDDAQIPKTELTEPPGSKPIRLRGGQLMGSIEDLC